MNILGGFKTSVIFFCIFVALASCDGDIKSGFTDTPKSGAINISVDESFKPVIEEQIAQYERLYPGTKINAKYEPEASALKSLLNDSSNRMIIITRPLTAKEENYLIDMLGFIPGGSKIASDALTLIVNTSSNDTVFTLDRLRNQLLGKLGAKQKIVFDGLSSTAAVRFITDSILKGEHFDTSVVKAAPNSQSVIDHIASNKNAVGIVGINWIGNPEDPKQVEMLKKVKICYVQCDACEGKPFVKPMIESIASRRYPLVRGLHYILKENFMGLGMGFSSFLKYEQGQLIFRRAYLRPVMDFDVRKVRLNENLPDSK